MTKKERLEALIAHYSNGKPTQFAKYIGVAPSTISTWLARDSFDYDLLFAKCENISPEWLFTGNGDMLKTTDESEPTIAEQRPAVTIYPAKHVDDGQQGIPLIPFSAMAGALRGEIQVCEYECEHYIVPEFKTANFLITINGDSMLPTYKSGDIVACQREAMTSVFFQWNRPYVLDTAQGAILKRIRPGSDKEHILIVSDNPAYNPFELPLSEIYSVALVVGFIRLE
jgi:bacteriophage CI repressor helix-turn-helix domain